MMLTTATTAATPADTVDAVAIDDVASRSATTPSRTEYVTEQI